MNFEDGKKIMKEEYVARILALYERLEKLYEHYKKQSSPEAKAKAECLLQVKSEMERSLGVKASNNISTLKL